MGARGWGRMGMAERQDHNKNAPLLSLPWKFNFLHLGGYSRKEGLEGALWTLMNQQGLHAPFCGPLSSLGLSGGHPMVPWLLFQPLPTP